MTQQSRRAVPAPDDRSDPTIHETARELRRSPSTIYRLIDAGELAAYKTGSRTNIRRESIEAMKDRNRIVPRSGAA